MIGLLNIDKPPQLTSHDVVARVRRRLGLRRVGHGGTLDPLATGVLIIAVGSATRLLEYVSGADKSYLATVRLGETTDSYDADGHIVLRRDVDVTTAAIAAALPRFVGTIQQLPPLYSAIKHQGQPLYKLARQGFEVERTPRTVTISRLQLLERRDNDIVLQIDCGSGTYIRSLAHDLGEHLGCGAHITQLQRTRVADFDLAGAIPLDAVDGAALLPLDVAIGHLPRRDLTAAETLDVRNGRRIARSSDHQLARAYMPTGEFVAILRADAAEWRPHKVFHPDN